MAFLRWLKFDALDVVMLVGWEMVGCGYICPGFPAAHGPSESISPTKWPRQQELVHLKTAIHEYHISISTHNIQPSANVKHPAQHAH